MWFDERVLPVAASRQCAAPSVEKLSTKKDGSALPRCRYEELLDERLENARVILCTKYEKRVRQLQAESVAARDAQILVERGLW